MTCPICKEANMHYQSISGKAGACVRCRNRMIPKYILQEQHNLYIKMYLRKNRKNYDTKERLTKGNS